MNTLEIIRTLSAESFQQFIRAHEHDDRRTFVLNNKEVSGIPPGILADQIAGRKKSKEKLPTYYAASGIIYPPSINLEQSSSEQTARFKAEILQNILKGKQIIGADLTGGFGVDAFFLSRAFKQLHFVEPEESLLEISRHNHQQLNATNIEYHISSAEIFIEDASHSCDFFYADPSRRTLTGRKVNAMEDSIPDVVKLSVQILKKSSVFLVKASPLLDIQAGLTQLPYVKAVFVISVDNECKEVLFVCEKATVGEPIIETVNLSNYKPSEAFSFRFSEERAHEARLNDPLQYLYEPNASILKAGAFKSIATRFNLQKIQKNTHLYTSHDLASEFPGRIFLVEKTIRGDRQEIKKYFPDGKANVTTRNYPLSAEMLKKKTGLKDGGEKFLIGFSGQQKKFLVVAIRQ
ncbi:MAG: class I SAM-dependent methyltransferase [Cyclobacteriaceae bacterium]